MTGPNISETGSLDTDDQKGPKTRPSLTIIIPVYNEADSISNVITEVIAKITPHYDLDLIIIDDGSNDKTVDRLKETALNHPGFRYLSHPRRSGKSAALRTGMLIARNLWVATMDGDGQDDPKNIINMAKKIDPYQIDRTGLVAGIRTGRTDGKNRKWASKLANGLRQKLLNDGCPDTACGLKLIARDLFLTMPFFDALHRYLPAMTGHLGFETKHVPVTNRPRTFGQSKYSNFGRAIAGLFDLIGVIWLMRRTHIPAPQLLLLRHQADRDIPNINVENKNHKNKFDQQTMPYPLKSVRTGQC